MVPHRLAPLVLMLAAPQPGCLKLAERARPDAPTVAGATGRNACTEESPLVVDWRAERRGDLEIAMREGLVVIKHDCDGTDIIDDCWIEGTYGFVGTTPKQEVVQVTNGTDLRARLPEIAATAGATLEGEFARGSSLDVAMVMVGKAMSNARTVRPDQLKGRCEGATHFVRGATIGAFAINTGSAARVRAAAEVFGAQAGGGSSSTKNISRRDGEIAACEGAVAQATAAPQACTAVLRLQLTGIDAPLPPGVAVSSADTTPPTRSCPPDDAAGCTALCDAGDVDACFVLGTIVQRGEVVPPDPNRANQLYKGACDMGHQDACTLLAISYLTGPDWGTGLKLLEHACELNNVSACATLAHTWREGTRPDAAKAAQYASKACTLGDKPSCAHAR